MQRKVFLKRGVNTLSAIGAGLATMSILLAFEGHRAQAWLLLGIGLIIDSIDGSLVRYFDLGGALPRYDGERLDEYADLIIYVVGPVGFAWAADLLLTEGALTTPLNMLGLATGVVVCAVSCLQFSRTDNKTDEAFWGFPSFWNVLYFYSWALDADPLSVIIFSLVLCVGVFAPIPFIYPSKLSTLKELTWGLAAVWLGILALYLVRPGWLSSIWLYISMLFPAYYLALSFYLYDELQPDSEDGVPE